MPGPEGEGSMPFLSVRGAFSQQISDSIPQRRQAASTSPPLKVAPSSVSRVAFGVVQLKPYMTRPLRFRASTTSVAVRVFARRHSQ